MQGEFITTLTIETRGSLSFSPSTCVQFISIEPAALGAQGSYKSCTIISGLSRDGPDTCLLNVNIARYNVTE